MAKVRRSMNGAPHAEAIAFALLADGQGRVRSLGPAELEHWQPADGFLWVHLHATHGDARLLLCDRFGVEPLFCDALLEEAGHPRCVPLEQGALLILRAPTIEPAGDATVGLGLWLESGRVISVSGGDPVALIQLRQQLAAGEGPTTPGDWPAHLLKPLVAGYRHRLDGMQAGVEALQEGIYEDQSRATQTRLSLLRRNANRLDHLLEDTLRLADDLLLLARELSWLTGGRKALREQRDRLQRMMGEMDSLKEHLHSLQDELNGLLDHHLNQRVYLLTVVTGVCFPLVFITGLLGVNVGGIPGSDNPGAFWILCLLLVLLGLVGGWLFHRRRWF